MPELLVDPIVSRAKYQREVERLRQNEDELRRRGCWLLETDFPSILVVFAVPQVRPASIAFGALLTFENYDLWPPSVRLVNPFTKEPHRYSAIPEPMRLLRSVPGPEVPGLGRVQGTQPMLVAHSPQDVPFICLPGIREYHDHPAHSGDTWFLHRGTPEGTAFYILDRIYTYGVQPIRGLQVGMQVTGFAYGEPPA